MKCLLVFQLCFCAWISNNINCNAHSNCVTGSDAKIDKWKVTSLLVEPFLIEGAEEPTESPVVTTAAPADDGNAANSSDAITSTQSTSPDDGNSTSSDTTPLEPSGPVASPQKGEKPDGKYSGYVVDLLDKLSKALNTPYEIELVPDNRYGKKEGDKWNGLIGQVCDGKAHIAAAPITVTVDRDEAIDFTYPLLGMQAVAVIQQDSEPVNSLQTLLENGYQLGISKDSTILKAMSQSKLETDMKAYANIQKGLMDDNTEGFRRVREDSQFAYIVEDTVANYVIKKPPCGLQVVPTDLYKRQYSFAVAQGSPLRDQINRVIVDWQADGTMVKLQRKWWGENECSGSDSLMHLSASISLVAATISILYTRFL